jgi:hypothetical protein
MGLALHMSLYRAHFSIGHAGKASLVHDLNTAKATAAIRAWAAGSPTGADGRWQILTGHEQVVPFLGSHHLRCAVGKYIRHRMPDNLGRPAIDEFFQPISNAKSRHSILLATLNGC